MRLDSDMQDSEATLAIKSQAHESLVRELIIVPCPAHKMRLLQAVYKNPLFWTAPELAKVKKAVLRSFLVSEIISVKFFFLTIQFPPKLILTPQQSLSHHHF